MVSFFVVNKYFWNIFNMGSLIYLHTGLFLPWLCSHTSYTARIDLVTMYKPLKYPVFCRKTDYCMVVQIMSFVSSMYVVVYTHFSGLVILLLCLLFQHLVASILHIKSVALKKQKP